MSADTFFRMPRSYVGRTDATAAIQDVPKVTLGSLSVVA